MEYLAEFSRKTPPSLVGVGTLEKQEDEIYAVENHTVVAPDFPPTVFGLVPQHGKVVIPKDSRVAGAVETTLIFLAGDYPHVHRRIEIRECPGKNCYPDIDRCPGKDCYSVGAPQGHAVTLLLRGAESRIQYRRLDVSAPLNALAVLRTLSGNILSSVSIE